MGAGILANGNFAVAQGVSDKLRKGDVAILQFLAAAEIIESDLWLQYQELGGVQDDEVATLASKLIPGYPANATGGNPLYMQDLLPLDRLRAELLRNMGLGDLLKPVGQPAALANTEASSSSLRQFKCATERNKQCRMERV